MPRFGPCSLEVSRDGETFEAEIEVGTEGTSWGSWRVFAYEDEGDRRVVSWIWNDDVVAWVTRQRFVQGVPEHIVTIISYRTFAEFNTENRLLKSRISVS